jgi:two-component system cell cycle sensor histidine kinase/response regulator CckA
MVTHKLRYKVLIIDGDKDDALIVRDTLDTLPESEMEDFIHNREKQYRIINENMRDTVWLMDMQMRTTWISPLVEKLRGYTLQELAEMPLDKHLTPESLQKAIAHISEYITPENLADKNKEITITVDLEFYKKDGTTFWGDTVISLLRDNKGNPSMFLCVGRDITERKRMEKELYRTNRILRTLSECNQSLIRANNEETLLNDISHNIVKFGEYRMAWVDYFNQNGSHLGIKAGYGDGYIEFADIIRSKQDGPINIAIKTGRPYIEKKVPLNPDTDPDTEVLKHNSVSVIALPLIENEKAFGVLAICNTGSDTFDMQEIDLLIELANDLTYGIITLRARTQRMLMGKSLIESEKKYRELVENLNDIILNVDVKGYITYISPSVNQILGYTVDEVTGKHLNQFVAIQNLPGLMSEFEQTMKGELHPYEFQMVAEDGKIHYVRTSSRPILENSEVVGLTVLLTDITTQRQLEEQFRQAQKMEAIGLLAGGIAHDFNNLLQVITGYSEILLRKLDESNSMRSFIEEIRKAGEQSTILTRQLLAFSHKQVLQQQVLSINDLINNISKMLKRIIGEDIELVVSLAPEIILLKIDPGQIEQIIMNLVVNARDAMSAGGKLTIKTESATFDIYNPLLIPESRPGDYVCLSISDTGVGMSKDILSHIFEPFFTTKGTMGTGLGLAVVYGVVKQHEGWINVYSEPNKGSVFKIYLPKFSKKSETEDQREPKLIELHGNGERILLVEDERQVREFVVSLIQESGYSVFVASSAAEAMEIFVEEDGNFHLIFTDVVLSDENGVQLVEKLLTINPNISVLLTSGYTNQKSQWNNIRDKGFRFIQKPYTVANLLKTVKEAIKEVSCII